MGRAIISTALFLASIGTGLAAGDRDSLPTHVEVEVSFSPQGECRATLTRFGHEPPYRRPTGRTYRLPNRQQHLVNALRESGRERISAMVHGRASVPEVCSGHALEAARLAGFRQVGFWLPPPVESGGPVERVSLCEVAADPMLFRGRRIKVRGFVSESRTPDGINHGLMDMECRAGIGLSDTHTGFWRLLGSGEARDRVVVMTVTGTPGFRTCYLIPPGSSCGPYFRVESFEDVERPDLCWGTQRVNNQRFEPITRPCPREPSDSAASPPA